MKSGFSIFVEIDEMAKINATLFFKHCHLSRCCSAMLVEPERAFTWRYGLDGFAPATAPRARPGNIGGRSCSLFGGLE